MGVETEQRLGTAPLLVVQKAHGLGLDSGFSLRRTYAGTDFLKTVNRDLSKLKDHEVLQEVASIALRLSDTEPVFAPFREKDLDSLVTEVFVNSLPNELEERESLTISFKKIYDSLFQDNESNKPSLHEFYGKFYRKLTENNEIVGMSSKDKAAFMLEVRSKATQNADAIALKLYSGDQDVRSQLIINAALLTVCDFRKQIAVYRSA